MPGIYQKSGNSCRRTTGIELIQFKDKIAYPSSTIFPNRLPGPGNHGFSLTSTSKATVILAGGTNLTLPSIVYSAAYEGVLNEARTDIYWNQIFSLKTARCTHAAFNLGQMLYFVGGNTGIRENNFTDTCEVYSVYEKSLSVGTKLPFSLGDMSALTDEAESFALIFGWEPVVDERIVRSLWLIYLPFI